MFIIYTTDSFDRMPTEDSTYKIIRTYKIIQSVMEFAAKVMKPMSLLEIDVEREKEILSAIDFVLPLKEEGVCLKVVIQQIFKFYNPRRLIIVSRPDVLDRVSRLIQFWDLTTSNCWKFFFVNELTLLDSVVGKHSVSKLKSIYNSIGTNVFSDVNEIKRREFGWWYQQIIKLAIPSAIADLSKVYVVWDSDLIVMKRWPLFMSDANHIGLEDPVVNAIPTVAILQEHSKKGAFEIYCKTLRDTVNIAPVNPEGGGTFVTHHMVFDCRFLDQFLKRISNNCEGLPWPVAIIKVSNSALRWSEYLCYASFALIEKRLNFHPYNDFGNGGIRLRNGEFGKVLLRMWEKNIPTGGFSMDHILKALKNFNEESLINITYIQVDHVYGNVPGSECSRHLPLLYPRTKWINQRYHNLNAYSYELFYGKKQRKEDGVVVANSTKQLKIIKRIQFWWKIFLSRQCIFIHIPKNAGTYVEYLLEPDLVQPKSLHVTAIELQEMWPSMFQKLFKFAIYRDPILRFISAYSYLHEGGNQQHSDLMWSQEIKKHVSFENFVRHLFCERIKNGTLASSWHIKMPIHFVPQYVFVYDIEGEVLVNTLLHIDDLKHDKWNDFITKHFQGNASKSSENATGSKAIRNSSSQLKKDIYSNLTEETTRILKEAYHEDYELMKRVTRL